MSNDFKIRRRDEVLDVVSTAIHGGAAAVNGRRYRQGRELADKATRRRIRRLGLNPESVGSARTCPVHAVLGRGLSILAIAEAAQAYW